MNLAVPGPWLACLFGICISAASHAQGVPSLREASDAAWALSPQSRSLVHRQAELDARARAAASPLAGAPSVSLAHRTDRVGSNGGLRESEAEVAAPLWNPGVRRATAAQVEADRAAFERELAAGRARIAADLRELLAQIALAEVEREVSTRRVEQAGQLAADVERRVRAGDAARVDLLQAQGVVQQAIGAQTAAEAASARLLAQWRATTGLQQAARLDEASGEPQDHPAVAAAQARVRAAESQLAMADVDRRDPVEVGVGFTRERAASGAGTQTSMRVAVRVPLGTSARNAQRVAAARAELATAQAELEVAQRTTEAAQVAARSDLEAARRAQAAAAERVRFARETQALIARSYQLGESDLPARLRAETERSDAELAQARAEVETRRAVSKLNQAFGILP